MTDANSMTLWPVVDGPAKGQHFAALGGIEVLYISEPCSADVRSVLSNDPPRRESMRKFRYELRELDTGGFVWTCEPLAVDTPTRGLVVSPAPLSRQGKFESGLVMRFGIKVGALAIRFDGSGYVNPAIQWLWEHHI